MKPSDLVKYVRQPDNGLLRTKQLNQVKIALQYKPIPFLIANELRRNTIHEEEYEQRYKELEGSQYYNLQISMPGMQGQNLVNYQVNSEEERQQRLYYLSFGLQNDIRLIEGGDTLRPILCHFERSYDMTPHRTFVLAFSQKTEKQFDDKTFILDSPVLGTGPLKLNIKGAALQNIPDLKLIQ